MRGESFKGTLMAQGFSKKYGVDYKKVFSHVDYLLPNHTLIVFDAENKLQTHRMDFVDASLNGDLKEEIYMRQPPGYVQPGKEELV